MSNVIQGLQHAVKRNVYKSFWLLVLVGLLCLLIHQAVLPLWLYGLYIFTVYCAYYFLKHQQTLLGSLLKLLVNCVVVLMVVVFYGKFTIDAAIGLLAASFVLKFLELHKMRDWLTAFAILCILMATMFYYNKEIKTAAWVMLFTVLLLSALNCLNSVRAYAIKVLLWNNTKLMLGAVPILIFFFVFFPRIAPLWNMPNQTLAKTGLSESMSPYDISELVNSDELVFRASTPIPLPNDQLYWRAFTMDDFDGVQWRRTLFASNDVQKMTAVTSQQFLTKVRTYFDQSESAVRRFDILLASNTKGWLYSVGVSSTANNELTLLSDLSLVSENKNVSYYTIDALTVDHVPLPISQSEQHRLLQLPSDAMHSNPKTDALIKQLNLAQLKPQDALNMLENYYKNEQLKYSMSPGVYEEGNTIDAFLFEKRMGFCAHFASSMVYMLRKIGIPARMIIGYQGGEFNTQGKFYTVRQYAAHAWVEAWLPSQGWVTYDPTKWASPSRINNGAEEHILETGSFSSSYASILMKNNPLARFVSQQLDNITYAWNKKIVKFSRHEQFNLLDKLIGNRSVLMQILYFGGVLVGCLAIGFMVMSIDFSKFKRTRQDVMLVALMRIFKRYKVEYIVTQTPTENIVRLSDLHPKHQQEFNRLATLINQYLFQEKQAAFKTVQQTKQILKQITILLRQLNYGK